MIRYERMQWIGFIVRGLFYTITIALLVPVLVLFRLDEEKTPGIDDGLGYGDNDPGEDADGRE